MAHVFEDLKRNLEEKLKSSGEPSAAQLAVFIRKMVLSIRAGLRWGPEVRVYLGSKNQCVREVERTFRKHMKWDFQENAPVKRSAASIAAGAKSDPPTTEKILRALEYLRQHFVRVEREGGTYTIAVESVDEVTDALASATSLTAPTKTAKGSSRSSVSTSIISREVKAHRAEIPAYVVRGSKKGSLPVILEKRKHGKVVTVIRNVEGDAKALLVELKHVLGTGGTVYPMRDPGKKPRDHVRTLKYSKKLGASATDMSGAPIHKQVEIQGDHLKRICAHLSKKGGLSGVNRHARAAAEALGKKKKKKSDSQEKKKIDASGRRVDSSVARRNKNMPDLSKPLDSKKVKSMNPTTLKWVLKQRGLSTQGSKKELLKRVLESNG